MSLLRPASTRRDDRMPASTAARGNIRAVQAVDLDPRLARVRRLAWILDRSIPIGGGMRVGLDPLIGLLPAGGDAIGVIMSLYVVYEGARLGLPFTVLARMVGNVLLEGLVGTIPLLGDVFDAAWGANMRNVALIDRHYRPERPARPLGRIVLGLGLTAIVLVSVVVFAAIIVVTTLWNWLS
ncbi:MAG TPA: DUF4112 domain-containing protein [Candidatus Synoicihabitans sp.]|nr:DUF4112 domain-containing protein [Candidatus Synoicihabitans sp.]